MSEENTKQEYDWMTENDDGTWTVNTKAGDYVMEELTENEMNKVARLSEKTKKPLQTMMARKCIISPETTDEDFGNLKASVTNRLKMCASTINGITDFL